MNVNRNVIWFRQKLLLYIAIWCLPSMLVFAQGPDPNQPKIDQLIPPSPEAAALAKFSTIPVSTYTGTPDINIPLYTLQYKDIGVPISLKYHASGFRVSEEASRVGLGWTVHAGGVISRTVRGNKDEKSQAYGYMNLAAQGWSVDCSDDNFVKNVANQGGYDGEPDAFSFNFMGMSGQFVFDTNGEVKTLNCSELAEFVPTIVAEDIVAWTVRDGNGYTYEFSEYDRSKNHSVTNGQTGTYTEWANTAWYLTKIISPLHDEVSFQYVEMNPAVTIRDVAISESSYHRRSQTSTDCETGMSYITRSANHIDQWMMLSGITSPNFVIEFNDGIPREDLTGTHSLGEIVIKETGLSDKVRSIQFTQSHFVSDGCTVTNDDAECYRLKLEQVDFLGFSPVNQNGTIGETYSFEYRAANLPRRDSYEQDHWGFFNDNGEDISLTPTLLPQTIIFYTNGTPLPLNGADREPNGATMLGCMLEAIQYPTGGRAEFLFEPHAYSRSGGQIFPFKIAGGARVKEIRMISGNGNPDMVTIYEYEDQNDPTLSSGMINAPIQYTYKKNAYKEWTEPNGVGGFDHFSKDCAYTIRSSSSQIPIMNTRGSHVGYDRVIEKQTGNGSTEYFYYSVQDFPDDLALINDPRYEKFYVRQNNDWKRGILEKKKVFDEAGDILQESDYDYSFPICETIKGLHAEIDKKRVLTGPGIKDEYFCYTVYDRRGWAKLDQVSETIYSQGSTALSTSKQSTYSYNSRNQLRSTEYLNTDGTVDKTESYYPGELDPDNAAMTFGIPEMWDDNDPDYQHILAPVMMSRTLQGIQPLSKIQANYSFNSSLDIVQLSGNEAFPSYFMANPNKIFFFYDEKGNLQGSEREDGIRTTILRTKDFSLPAARVLNGANGNCAYTSFDFGVEEDPSNGGKRIDGNWEMVGSGGWDRADARTGIGRYNVSANNQIRTSITDGDIYTLSFWTTSNKNLENDFDITPAYSVIHDGETEIDGWKYYELEMTLTTGQEVKILGNQSPVTYYNWIDELRLYPSDAQMNSISYDEYLRVHTMTDANNQSVFYTYDEIGRLIEVRDFEGNLLNVTEYHYTN